LGWVLALSLTLGRGPSLAASFVAFGQCGAVFRLFVADSFMKYLLLWSLAPAEISVSVPRFRPFNGPKSPLLWANYRQPAR